MSDRSRLREGPDQSFPARPRARFCCGISGRCFLRGREPSIWRGVHGLHEGKAQDAEGVSGKRRRKKQRKKNQTLPYPSHDELRAEAEEAKSEVYFMVDYESGAPIRRVDGSAEAGFQRVAWDLRYPAGQVPKKSGEEEFFPDAGPGKA